MVTNGQITNPSIFENRKPWTDLLLLQQIQFKVEGTVQGVNFRSFTVDKARGLNLTGYVKNASDGSVRLLPT